VRPKDHHLFGRHLLKRILQRGKWWASSPSAVVTAGNILLMPSFLPEPVFGAYLSCI
jgi:hypothetical protein